MRSIVSHFESSPLTDDELGQNYGAAVEYAVDPVTSAEQIDLTTNRV